MLLLLQFLSSDNHSKGRLHISNNQRITHTLPWQPGQRLAAVTVSCAADGCQNGQPTPWTNPSPGNKRQPCSITPYARGVSGRLGWRQFVWGFPPAAEHIQTKLYCSVYSVVMAKFMPLMWPGLASSANFAQSCARACCLHTWHSRGSTWRWHKKGLDD